MELQKVLKYFFETSHIPLAVYDQSKLRMEFCVRKFEPGLAFHCIQSRKVRSMDLSMDQNGMICGVIRDQKSGLLIAAGPVLEFPCTKKKAFSILKQMKEPINRAEELIYYFAKIPRMPLVVFYKNLSFLNYIINEEEPEDDYMDQISNIKHPLRLEAGTDGQSHPGVHGDAKTEARLLACVEFGKTEELDYVLRKILPEDCRMGQAAQDSIRSVRNVMIASVAIVARYAVKGGMDYEAAMELSDTYLQRLDVMDSYDEIINLWGTAVFDYTARVGKVRSLNTKSKLAKKVAGYVQSHIYGTVTAEEIAAFYGYHISYLSRMFRQETGKNIRDYINEEKIEEAKKLLAFSDKTIMEVSLLLGFSSQAYFTTVFKKITQLTPAKYRKMRVE